jgi:HAD superfamily hydrolase (TIGR01549 family)
VVRWPGVRISAVLFDLDDTLFDHRQCTHIAVAAVRERFAELQPHPLEHLEREHARLVEELHPLVVGGRLSIGEGRRRRFARLFESAGAGATPEVSVRAEATYREAYERARCPVPGATALLALLKSRGIAVGVVTNNIVAEQVAKLRCCGLTHLVDALVCSEEIGVSKPDRAIFEAALDRLGRTAVEAVMVGDSWPADIVGGHHAGLRCVWLNRFGLFAPQPGLAREIHALEPTADTAAILLS